MITAKQYLQDLGITKENTLLAVFIDGVIRNPDLEKLMEDYALLRKLEKPEYNSPTNPF